MLSQLIQKDYILSYNHKFLSPMCYELEKETYTWLLNCSFLFDSLCIWKQYIISPDLVRDVLILAWMKRTTPRSFKIACQQHIRLIDFIAVDRTLTVHLSKICMNPAAYKPAILKHVNTCTRHFFYIAVTSTLDQYDQ